MTDQTAQEPTMEEILASIRRIISEDDAPAETASAAAAPAEAEFEPELEPAAAEDSPALMDETPAMQEPVASEEDVLELTDTYEAPVPERIGDLEVTAAGRDVDPFPVEAVSESVFAPEPEHPADTTSISPPDRYDTLVGDSAAASAASAFAGLASSLKKSEPMESATPSGPTLDELARALLRPMLKEWLDANLPGIVEAQERKEVERIARNAG
jgi:cell pole-organizing protein PopZ